MFSAQRQVLEYDPDPRTARVSDLEAEKQLLGSSRQLRQKVILEASPHLEGEDYAKEEAVGHMRSNVNA